MISQRTVFVLGAGASKDYGFPTGDTFRKDIISTLRTPPSGLINEIVPRIPFAKHLGDMLDNSNLPSIDAFLEGADLKDEAIKMCKKCIVHIIGTREPASLPLMNSGWYTTLWHKMYMGTNANPDKLQQNQVSFITFNYDRSLENFFERSIRATVRDEIKAEEILNHINIIHIYGQIGRLPWQNRFKGELPVFEYGEHMDWSTADTLSSGIKVMHEGEEVKENFKQAREWLARAEKICFLGFGYHYDNLERLSQYPRSRSQKIMGTYYKPALQVPPGIGDAAANGFKRNIKIIPLHQDKNALSSYVAEVADLR